MQRNCDFYLQTMLFNSLCWRCWIRNEDPEWRKNSYFFLMLVHTYLASNWNVMHNLSTDGPTLPLLGEWNNIHDVILFTNNNTTNEQTNLSSLVIRPWKFFLLTKKAINRRGNSQKNKQMQSSSLYEHPSTPNMYV